MALTQNALTPLSKIPAVAGVSAQLSQQPQPEDELQLIQKALMAIMLLKSQPKPADHALNQNKILNNINEGLAALAEQVFPQQPTPSTSTPTPTPSYSAPKSPSINVAPSKVNLTERMVEACNFFVEKGWTPQQAAGMVANFVAESGLNHQIVGDSGAAYGIAQWHPDRQKAYKARFGHDIREADFRGQLEFVHFELTEGKEQAAGKALKATTTSSEAAIVVSTKYERPLHREAEASKRAGMASGMEAKNLFAKLGANKGLSADGDGPRPDRSSLKLVGTNKAIDPERTLFVGDSIMLGTARALGAGPENNLAKVNSGLIGGRSLLDQQMAGISGNKKGMVVVVGLGPNDAFAKYTNDPAKMDAYRQDFGNLLDRIQSTGAEARVMLPLAGGNQADALDHLRGIQRSVAQERGIAIVDPSANATFARADGVHPISYGQVAKAFNIEEARLQKGKEAVQVAGLSNSPQISVVPAVKDDEGIASVGPKPRVATPSVNAMFKPSSQFIEENSPRPS